MSQNNLLVPVTCLRLDLLFCTIASGRATSGESLREDVGVRMLKSRAIA